MTDTDDEKALAEHHMRKLLYHGIACFVNRFSRLPERDEIDLIAEMVLEAVKGSDPLATRH